MNTRGAVIALMGSALASGTFAQSPLPAPGFHHLHLNSTDPDAAIAYYVKAFPSTSRTTWGGMPALKTGKMWVLFTKVKSPPALEPQTAIWHFGWHVTDERATYKRYQETGIKLLPLWTGDGDGFVYVNSDSWPGAGGPGGSLGRTKSQIAEAKEKGLKPLGGAGFAYIGAPDGAMIEYQGNMPAERFNHVHMYQNDPFCATLWYQKHLNAPGAGRGPAAQYSGANCKVSAAGREKSWPALDKGGMYRVPVAGSGFDDVSLPWYMNPGDKPLVSTKGHLADHFALSVGDLDAWLKKLHGEGVRILRKPYKLGDTRAFMIEGPSLEQIELVEVK